MAVAGDSELSLPHGDPASALSERVTEREKYFIAAQYFSAHQQFETARDSLKAVTTLYPEDPELRYELASAHYALENLRVAIAELRQAIRINPHGARAQGSLVLFLARNNQPDAALDASKEAQRNGIDSPYLYWARGLAFSGKGDIAAARNDFAKLTATTGYYRHLGLLQEARLSLLEDNLPAAIAGLDRAVEVTRLEGNPALELAPRLQLARAYFLTTQRQAAVDQLAQLRHLTDSAVAGPEGVEHAGQPS